MKRSHLLGFSAPEKTVSGETDKSTTYVVKKSLLRKKSVFCFWLAPLACALQLGSFVFVGAPRPMGVDLYFPILSCAFDTDL